MRSTNGRLGASGGTGPRVLVVSLSPHVWGAERSLLGLAPLLVARGVDLTLACPPGSLAEAWSETGSAYRELPASERAGLRTAEDGRPGPGALAQEIAHSAGMARRLRRVAVGFDVVHSNSLWGHLDCAIAGRLARRPVVLELHDLVRPGLGRAVLTGAVLLASRTIAVSHAVAATVGTRADRVCVIPQAVDAERFHPGPPDASWRARLSSQPDVPIVGIVGRVDPEKGIDSLVRAMSMLDGPARRSHLAVVGASSVGDGAYEAQLRAEASTLLGDRCRFVGPVADVPAVLRSLDVLVNASTSEPFGLSVLEAQASGVPVIGTESGGIPEFVVDGETGVLVAPGRPEELAAGLTRILGTAGFGRDLARTARQHVVAHHTLADRADAVADLYGSLARRRASAIR